MIVRIDSVEIMVRRITLTVINTDSKDGRNNSNTNSKNSNCTEPLGTHQRMCVLCKDAPSHVLSARTLRGKSAYHVHVRLSRRHC